MGQPCSGIHARYRPEMHRGRGLELWTVGAPGRSGLTVWGRRVSAVSSKREQPRSGRVAVCRSRISNGNELLKVQVDGTDTAVADRGRQRQFPGFSAKDRRTGACADRPVENAWLYDGLDR